VEPTQNPAPAGAKSLTFEVVSDKPPHRNPWRPTVLTVRKFLRICDLVEQGFATNRACECEQISYRRFRERVSGNKRLEERLKRSTDARFAKRHEEAISTILAASQHSWAAAAWWCERNLPQLYALRAVQRPELDKDGGVEPDIPAERLAQYRRVQLELLKEDLARENSEASPE
jgi:hypothetical protein